jgi:hypothetical protein
MMRQRENLNEKKWNYYLTSKPKFIQLNLQKL